MRRLHFTVLAIPFLLLACGGSDAGNVFDKPSGGDDTGASAETSGSTDTSTPVEEDSNPPPPIDSGTPSEDTSAPPPPMDTGMIGVDTTPPPPDVTTVACSEPGSKTFGGHCYFPTNYGRWWSTARDICAGLKAHLVTITSAEEQAVVQSIGSGDRWIGLARPDMTPATASSYKWITAETSSYSRWYVGEPNGSGYCVRLRGDGTWADYGCSTNLIAICERE
jgi:hypothetical protein